MRPATRGVYLQLWLPPNWSSRARDDNPPEKLVCGMVKGKSGHHRNRPDVRFTPRGVSSASREYCARYYRTRDGGWVQTPPPPQPFWRAE